MRKEDIGRPVVIHLCKDGTISYRRKHEPVFNGVALPVFTVDNEEQAQAVQIRFGRLQWHEHPQMPGKAWYRWTDFSGNADDLDAISDKLRAFYETELKPRMTRAHGFVDFAFLYMVALLYGAILLTIPYPFEDDTTVAAAICDTDTDCMRHCPPPADDPDCDGGPQS